MTFQVSRFDFLTNLQNLIVTAKISPRFHVFVKTSVADLVQSDGVDLSFALVHQFMITLFSGRVNTLPVVKLGLHFLCELWMDQFFNKLFYILDVR